MNFFMEKIHYKKEIQTQKLCFGKKTPNSVLAEEVLFVVMIYQQFADKSLQITIYPETKYVESSLADNK